MNLNHLMIIFLLVFFILYSSISLTSPMGFGDEGFYAAESRWIAKNGYPVYEPMRGTDIFHEKIVIPPLYSIIQAFSYAIDGDIGIRFLIPIFSILSAGMIYLFLKRLGKQKAGFITAIIFLSTMNIITYSILNYTDTLLVLMFICAAYFFYFASKIRDFIITGIFCGLAFLTKGTGFLILPILILYFILDKKHDWKGLVIVVLTFIIIISPWIVRSLVLYNAICYHPILLNGCEPVIDKTIPMMDGLNFTGRVQATGTEVNAWEFGIMNYFIFAFGLLVTILFIFGISSMFFNKRKINPLIYSWLFIFIIVFILSITTIFNSAGRAEDTARYTLPIVIPLSMLAGLFLEDLFEYMKKHNNLIAMMFMLVLVLLLIFSAYQKLDSLKTIKNFSEGFFKGCDWIKQNMPNDSIIFSIYAHQTMYFCDRKATSFVPDKAEILLTDNNTSYEHLRLHGFDYVFIQAFTVSNDKYSEGISMSFLKYLDSSSDFKMVYQNFDIYGQGGVIVYQILGDKK